MKSRFIEGIVEKTRNLKIFLGMPLFKPENAWQSADSGLECNKQFYWKRREV